MPISGGKYVSPTWHNNAAPALDAAELQAMTDTIEGNQEPQSSAVQLSAAAQAALGLGSGSTLDDAMELLGETYLHIDSRIGTGEVPFTVTFPQKPKMVFWLGAHDGGTTRMGLWFGCFIPGVDMLGTNGRGWIVTYGANDDDCNAHWSSDGTSLTISYLGIGSSSVVDEFNDTDRTYYYAYIV